MKSLIQLPAKCIRLLVIQRSDYRSIFSWGLFRRLFGGKRAEHLHYRWTSNIERFFKARIERLYTNDLEKTYSSFAALISKSPSKILDIGAGMGGINVLTYKNSRNPKPEIWLLDKSGETPFCNAGFHQNAEDFSYYNSFDLAIDCLVLNGVPKEKIKTVDILSSPFPQKARFDLIYSFLSLGFHYSVSVYLDQTYNALSEGGTLIIDVRRGTEGEDFLRAKFLKEPMLIYEEEKFVRYAVRK